MGEAIGSVSDGPANPGRFEGYTDRQATEDKLLRDVFVPGDVWFRTGDLMRKDEKGYFYFVDRIGDTFRWKGENASTSEVAAVIQRFAGVADVSVYGVAVPALPPRSSENCAITWSSICRRRRARCSCGSARGSRPRRHSSIKRTSLCVRDSTLRRPTTPSISTIRSGAPSSCSIARHTNRCCPARFDFETQRTSLYRNVQR
jgi:acyl-CoA synthetase (AMP-forming)/AMP-acid ligase II